MSVALTVDANLHHYLRPAWTCVHGVAFAYRRTFKGCRDHSRRVSGLGFTCVLTQRCSSPAHRPSPPMHTLCCTASFFFFLKGGELSLPTFLKVDE